MHRVQTVVRFAGQLSKKSNYARAGARSRRATALRKFLCYKIVRVYYSCPRFRILRRWHTTGQRRRQDLQALILTTQLIPNILHDDEPPPPPTHRPWPTSLTQGSRVPERRVRYIVCEPIDTIRSTVPIYIKPCVLTHVDEPGTQRYKMSVRRAYLTPRSTSAPSW
jgi:hypothetical protein